MSTRFDEYLHRPQQLKDMTYPDSHGGVNAVVMEGETLSAEGNLPCLRSRSTDDFEQFIGAKRIKTNAIDQLSLALYSITNETPDVMILLRCVKSYNETKSNL